MIYKIKDLKPSEMVHLIADNILVNCPDAKDAIYIILGRPGPTGKTWLFNALRTHLGLNNVVEISEDLNVYPDCTINPTNDHNYLTYNQVSNHVVIVLNTPLEVHRHD